MTDGISKNKHLSLENKKLKSLEFLTKFLHFFPRISSLNLNSNSLVTNREMEPFLEALEHNHYIQNIKVEGTRIQGSIKARMTTELIKNQKINRLLKDENVLLHKTVNL